MRAAIYARLLLATVCLHLGVRRVRVGVVAAQDPSRTTTRAA
jgi:hypothetical protein